MRLSVAGAGPRDARVRSSFTTPACVRPSLERRVIRSTAVQRWQTGKGLPVGVAVPSAGCSALRRSQAVSRRLPALRGRGKPKRSRSLARRSRRQRPACALRVQGRARRGMALDPSAAARGGTDGLVGATDGSGRRSEAAARRRPAAHTRTSTHDSAPVRTSPKRTFPIW